MPLACLELLNLCFESLWLVTPCLLFLFSSWISQPGSTACPNHTHLSTFSQISCTQINTWLNIGYSLVTPQYSMLHSDMTPSPPDTGELPSLQPGTCDQCSRWSPDTLKLASPVLTYTLLSNLESRHYRNVYFMCSIFLAHFLGFVSIKVSDKANKLHSLLYLNICSLSWLLYNCSLNQ